MLALGNASVVAVAPGPGPLVPQPVKRRPDERHRHHEGDDFVWADVEWHGPSLTSGRAAC